MKMACRAFMIVEKCKHRNHPFPGESKERILNFRIQNTNEYISLQVFLILQKFSVIPIHNPAQPIPPRIAAVVAS